MKLLQYEKVPLYEKVYQMRECTYVEDCVDDIDTVFTNGSGGDVYNIGSGSREITNYYLTKKLLTYLWKYDSYIEYVPDRLGMVLGIIWILRRSKRILDGYQKLILILVYQKQ